jgi:hypothetical protein
MAAAVVTVTLVGGTSAQAATTIGDECVATLPAADATFVLVASTGGLPTTAPSDGVITKWQINLPVGPGPAIPTNLKVFTPQPGPNEFRVDAVSAPEAVGGGTSTFNARLPIQAGDHVGIRGGAPGTPVCSPKPAGNAIAAIAGDAPAGSVATYTGVPEVSLPLVVTIEPDADGDGFGDETQDQCPQNATTQLTCPKVELDVFGSPGPKSLTLAVVARPEAEVEVKGKVKPRGSKAIALKGGKKTVPAGKLTLFKVRYPKPMRKALAELPASKSLTVKLSARAENVLGVPTTSKTKVKVSGTA